MKTMKIVCAALLVVGSFVGGCKPASEPEAAVELRSEALTVSATNLALQVSENSCWNSGSQSFFQVKNNDASTVKLSDVTIKFWINDTTGSPVVPHVWYGGCVTSPNGTCVHPVSNVTASASKFTACGPDAQHQANWEITVSNTDSTTISPGNTWSNLQTAINLASYASFSPGSNTWYSACGSGQPYQPDAHFSVYVKGDLVTNLGITAPECRAPHGSQAIGGYSMPPASPQVGSLPKDTVLTLALSLPLRSLSTLQATIDAAADPASPTYRQWLKPAELEATYLPTTNDFSTLTAWATSKGLQVSSQPSHMVAGLVGTVAKIEAAFFVNMITARRPDGTIYYTPDRRPTLELGTQVLGISGIDDFIPARVAASGGRAPNPPGGLQSNDFRDGYLGAAPSSCASLTGAGQTIGVFTYGTGFNQSDVQAYITNTGLTGVSTPTINVAGTPSGTTPTPLASDDGSSGLEASLDIEMAIAMAPGAQVVVFEGNNLDLTLEAMVNQPNIAQLTSSWYLPTSATTPQLHTLMAAQGQAFFEASLDFGSYAVAAAPQPVGSSCLSAPMGPNVTFDMPYITLVGGTELNVLNGAYQSESAWAGSGGGILPSVSLPPWQANANSANAKLSATSRNVPDVAMPANGIYVVYSTCDNQALPGIGGKVAANLCTNNVQCNSVPDGKGGVFSVYSGCKAGGETKGTATTIGGTSAATPLWAGFMALANQKNQAQGRIGFPNPTIYAIGRGPSYATSFNDIKHRTSSPAACDGTQSTAVAGYDQTTGWGSPKCGLISQLSPGVVTPPSPPS